MDNISLLFQSKLDLWVPLQALFLGLTYTHIEATISGMVCATQKLGTVLEC